MAKPCKKMRTVKEFHDGFSDRLQPLTPLDLEKCRTVSDLVDGMSRCNFGAISASKSSRRP